MIDVQSLWGFAPAILLLYLSFKLNSHRRKAKFCAENGCKAAPPVTQKWWLFGLDAIRAFEKSTRERVFLRYTVGLFKNSGRRTISVNLGPGYTYVWTMSPENAKAMMASKAEDFDISKPRMDSMEPYLGSAPETSTGTVWVRSRAVLRSAFAKAQVNKVDIYERHFQYFAANVATHGVTIDLKVLFSRLTLDVATDLFFGEPLNSQNLDAPKSTRKIDQAFDIVSKCLRDRFNLGPLLVFHRDPEFKRALSILHGYTDSIISKAIQDRQSTQSEKPTKEAASPGARLVFLDELITELGDRKIMRDLLLSAVSGGRDTTGALLSQIFYFLCRIPAALQRLRDEISQLGGQAPTYTQLKDLKYLRWVVDETLRLAPGTPVWEREAVRDTILPNGGGDDGEAPLFVAKGQMVQYIFYALCHDQQQWGEDVEQFRPERWDGLRYGWHYTPFGGGGRICPGQQLALNEASYITVRMLQTFGGLENRDETPWEEGLSVNLSPFNGCKVSLSR